MTGDRIKEAKAIIGLAWTTSKDKHLQLHKPLPPLTNNECLLISKDMQVSYQSVRRFSPRFTIHYTQESPYPHNKRKET